MRLSAVSKAICPYVFFLAFPATLCSQAGFEGIIESKNSTTDERGAAQQFTMKMFVKGDRVRIENSSAGGQPGSTMIYRGDRKVIWMLNDDDKTYFEIKQNQQPDEVLRPSGQALPKPAVRRSGKKKAILQFPAEQFVVEEGDITTEIWATKSLGQLYATLARVLGTGGEPGGEEWENEMMKRGYFPLIAASKLNGKVVESQEVTGIRKQSLDAGLFELPAGYAKQSPEGGP